MLIERSMGQIFKRIRSPTDSFLDPGAHQTPWKKPAHFRRRSITNQTDPHYWLHNMIYSTWPNLLCIPKFLFQMYSGVHEGSLMTSEHQLEPEVKTMWVVSLFPSLSLTTFNSEKGSPAASEYDVDRLALERKTMWGLIFVLQLIVNFLQKAPCRLSHRSNLVFIVFLCNDRPSQPWSSIYCRNGN